MWHKGQYIGPGTKIAQIPSELPLWGRLNGQLFKFWLIPDGEVLIAWVDCHARLEHILFYYLHFKIKILLAGPWNRTWYLVTLDKIVFILFLFNDKFIFFFFAGFFLSRKIQGCFLCEMIYLSRPRERNAALIRLTLK